MDISVYAINKGYANFHTILSGAAKALETAMTGGLATFGYGPKDPSGTRISSKTQQEIVESQAGFKFTNTTIKRFVDPSRHVDAKDLQRAVGGTAYSDPQGSGASAYYTTILRNGKNYNLKVVYNEESNTIFHFHYSRQAMGPLSKIKK